MLAVLRYSVDDRDHARDDGSVLVPLAMLGIGAAGIVIMASPLIHKELPDGTRVSWDGTGENRKADLSAGPRHAAGKPPSS